MAQTPAADDLGQPVPARPHEARETADVGAPYYRSQVSLGELLLQRIRAILGEEAYTAFESVEFTIWTANYRQLERQTDIRLRDRRAQVLGDGRPRDIEVGSNFARGQFAVPHQAQDGAAVGFGECL